MTHQDLADIQLATYKMAPCKWDVWCDGTGDNDIVYGIKIAEGRAVVAFRGSVDPLDWFRDFRALADPFRHDALGPVHPGFYCGMENVWVAVRPVIKDYSPVVIGHSLGAARATVLTALMVRDDQPPVERVVWGEPKSGFAKMAALIAGVRSTSYCNASQDQHHRDLVTTVPYTLLIEEYVRAGNLTFICAPPPEKDSWGALAWHHMNLYRDKTQRFEVRG